MTCLFEIYVYIHIFNVSTVLNCHEKEEDRLRREFLLDGKQVLPKQKTELFDSNIITPGTEFMFKLSKELQTYVHRQMKNNPGWKNVKVNLCFETSILRTTPIVYLYSVDCS